MHGYGPTPVPRYHIQTWPSPTYTLLVPVTLEIRLVGGNINVFKAVAPLIKTGPECAHE